LKSLILAQP